MVFSKHKSFERLSFKEKFRVFNDILDQNDKAHQLMDQLSEAISSAKPFSSQFAVTKLEALFHYLEKMSYALSKLSGKDYSELNEIIRKLKIETRLALIPKIKCPENLKCQDIECNECKKLEQLYNDTPYYFDLSEVNSSHLIQVGNKMARLGEIKNKLHLPVPDGFCLTIKLFDDILSHNNLRNKKNKLLNNIDFNNPRSVQYISNQIQALMISTELPDYLERMIYSAYHSKFERKDIMLAVRSSAFGEDSENHSFAGLHRSILNVTYEHLIDSVMKVLVSLYSPQSVTYRFLSGIRDEDMPISVGCIEMVDAVSAGVLYTTDPNAKREGMVVQGVWGLGSQVLDGIVRPQEFLIKEIGSGFELVFNNKKQIIYLDKLNLEVKDYRLQPKELIELYNYAKLIEKHFSGPQDIEWALDKKGKICILQARPLLVKSSKTKLLKEFSLEQYDKINPPIIASGDCASSGIGYGPVFKINSLRDIVKVSEGSVVVAKKCFIELTSILHKVSAVITDIGSTTGHLAIIARELKVPLLINTISATELLNDDESVTIISDERRVYKGYVEILADLLNQQNEKNNIFIKSPIYKIWSNLIKSFFTLNLIDPSSETFKIENCKSLHDIIRFIHEISMKQMFVFYSDTNLKDERTYKLKSDLPLNIYVIDLDNEFNDRTSNEIKVNEIASPPFIALMEGMTSEGIVWSGYVGMDTKGFAEMIMQNVASTNLSNLSENTQSYAFVSKHYLNFFSQLGFHFSRLDAFISDNINHNYINFNFRGGATTDFRKSLRAIAISKILEHFYFTTIVKADDVSAKINHIKMSEALNLLKMLGRLMGFIRNADVLMKSESSVELFVKSFLEGDATPKLYN